ncbi:hypothetical protein MPER_04296, partial [Moniliophthora perniciosa FA553]
HYDTLCTLDPPRVSNVVGQFSEFLDYGGYYARIRPSPVYRTMYGHGCQPYWKYGMNSHKDAEDTIVTVASKLSEFKKEVT